MADIKELFSKCSKKTQRLLVVGVLLCFFLLIGISYSYYRVGTTVVNGTETKIETKKMGLTYTGSGTLEINNMIPGDSFVKTFQIENTSNVAVQYNIYMETITNEFNEDLVYKITDDANNVIVPQQPLPASNDGKVYLKRGININVAPAVHRYILTVEYLYKPDVDQSVEQGNVFLATISMDTDI